MTKNTLLNIAITISKLLKIIFIISAIVLTVLFVYVQIYDEAFANLEMKLSLSSNSFGHVTTASSVFEDADKNISTYTIGELKSISLYVMYFKGLIIMTLIFMTINAFEKIMLSVKTLKTFNSNNSKLFRKTGLYIIAIAILTSYSVLRFENGIQSKLSVDFILLIYALIAFIMAEIFKEGNALKQENDLTI